MLCNQVELVLSPINRAFIGFCVCLFYDAEKFLCLFFGSGLMDDGRNSIKIKFVGKTSSVAINHEKKVLYAIDLIKSARPRSRFGDKNLCVFNH